MLLQMSEEFMFNQRMLGYSITNMLHEHYLSFHQLKTMSNLEKYLKLINRDQDYPYLLNLHKIQ